jgi:autotransporter translocation and assembly factor TamB
MTRTSIVSTALIAGLFTASGVAAAPAARAAQSAAPLTAADAAPFIGDWSLDLQGPDRSATLDLTVKLEKETEKVTGEISGGTMALQAITDITKAGQSLVLSYSFNYEGTPVDAVVRLTPAPEGKMKAQIDFAGGAYTMSGTATKKEKAK